MAANQFMVFGYDLRDYGRLWLSAWRDLLLGDDSPIRAALDSIVVLTFPDGSRQTFQAGQPLEATSSAVPLPEAPEAQALETHRAVALSEELVLSRTLQLPALAETDLEAALSLEVGASSPFAPDDTAAGWRLWRSESGTDLHVDLVLVSRSAVMAYLGEAWNLHSPQSTEVWAPVANRWVVVRGFGEFKREKEYKRRLLRSAAMVSVCLLLFLAIVGASTLFSGMRLAKLETIQTQVLADSKTAMQLRDRLSAVNGIVTELNTLSKRLPSPQRELARLTEFVPNSAYITQYTQNGRDIRLRGRGKDGATLQQELTEKPIYASVKSSQAISRVGNSELDQFVLDLQLRLNR